MIIVDVTGCVPFPRNLEPQSYSYTINTRVGVPVGAKGDEFIQCVNSELARQNLMQTSRTALIVTALHQPDSEVVDGRAKSATFDQHVAKDIPA
jgi:hypothetical protein